jgi:hypothetical protein
LLKNKKKAQETTLAHKKKNDPAFTANTCIKKHKKA